MKTTIVVKRKISAHAKGVVSWTLIWCLFSGSSHVRASSANTIAEDRNRLIARLNVGLTLVKDEIKTHKIHLKQRSSIIPDTAVREQFLVLLESLDSPEELVLESATRNLIAVLGEYSHKAEKIRTHTAFGALHDRIKRLTSIEKLLPAFTNSLSILIQTYENFIKTFVSLCPLDGEKALKPKVKLLGTHLSPSLIGGELAHKLISKTHLSIVAKQNESGGHAVASHEGVHFKVYDSEIGLCPGGELAMHHLYTLLIGEGVAPTALLCLEDIPLFEADYEDKTRKRIAQAHADGKSYDHLLIEDPHLAQEVELRKKTYPVQAAFSIDGIGFDKFLENVEFATWLREYPYRFSYPEGYFFDQNGSMIDEDNSRYPFIKRFFRPIKKAKNARKPRKIDELKWSDFLKGFNHNDWSFENLDQDNVAKMVLMSFMTEPDDAKADNFMVYKDAVTKKWKLISIDSDRSLEAGITKITHGEPRVEHRVEHKCIFYLLPSIMNRAVPVSVKEYFKTLNAPLILAKWLATLEEENEAYAKLQRESSLPKATFDHMKLPIQFERGKVTLLLRHIESLQNIFIRDNGFLTLNRIFELIHPVLHSYYKEMQVRFPHNPLGAIYNNQDATVERVIGEKKLNEMHEGISLRDRLQEYNVPAQTLKYNDSLKIDVELRQVHDKIHQQRCLGETFKELGQEIEARKSERTQDPTSPKILNLQELILEAGIKRDLAEKEKREIVYLLKTAILCEGPQTVDPGLGRQFYQRCLKKSGFLEQDEELKDAWSRLLKHNSALAWYCGLDDFFLTEQECRQCQQLSSRIYKAVGAAEGERYISSETWDQLFEKNGRFIKVNTNGAHEVGKASRNGVTFYFKRYPKLPGIEEAVGRLHRQLIGFGAPHVELFRIENIPYLVSQEVKGLTIKETLGHSEKVSKPASEPLLTIDPESLGRILVMSMLIHPEDGNASNYIVESIPSPQQLLSNSFRLICVDNDQAFVPSMAKTPGGAQVKSILYCMDQDEGSYSCFGPRKI